MREEEEEQEMIKLKKIPSVPLKEGEEKEKPQKVTTSTVFAIEELVHQEEEWEMLVSTRQPTEERKPRDKAEMVKKPEVVKPKGEEKKETPKDAWTHKKPTPKDGN